ncbi:MAG: DUF1302 family protein [Nevskia sp.]|nr:DUF1302 family protein [Nevskia sp.]
MRKLPVWGVVALSLASGKAVALSYDLEDGATLVMKNRFSTGVQMRLEPIDNNLTYKLNVPGQQNLCAPDDCLSLTGDPRPNQRLVNAKGAYVDLYGQGDLNYKQYDITAATNLFDSDWTLTWNNWLLRARGVGYYDPVNADFEETHPNTMYQPAHTPRNKANNNLYARGAELLDAYAQYSFEVYGHNGTITAGEQTVHWGESTLVAFNSINEINPPNAAILHMPGSEIGEVFQPVPMIDLSFDPVEHATVEGFYQFGFKPDIADAVGSFYSVNNLLSGYQNYVNLSFGQWSEDPNRQYKVNPGLSNGVLSTLSGSTRTLRIGPTLMPPDGGQYGVRLSYLADWLNDGTELGAYFMNYHSRAPYISLYAANESCARNVSGTGVGTVLTLLRACKGGTGTLRQQPIQDLANLVQAPNVAAFGQLLDQSAIVRGLADGIVNILAGSPGPGLELMPADTVLPAIEYPANIQMYGLSFNTTVLGWSLAGEYSFRPNMPVQVNLTDLFFAAAQPAFPRNEIKFTLPTFQPPLGTVTYGVPPAHVVLPDYLEGHRHTEIQPNQYVRGYDRLQVGQFDLTALRAISKDNNFVGADQVILIGEFGFCQVFNLPSLDQEQYGDINIGAHRSPGEDGTGQPGGLPPGVDGLTLNPTYNSNGYVTSFAWGLRTGVRMEYNDLIFGWSFKPQIILSHDFQGIDPLQFANFIAGRTSLWAATEIDITQQLSGHIEYNAYTGGRQDNLMRDRDNISLSLAYSF